MADNEKKQQPEEKPEVIEIDYSDLFKHHKKSGDKPTERGSKDGSYNGIRR